MLWLRVRRAASFRPVAVALLELPHQDISRALRRGTLGILTRLDSAWLSIQDQLLDSPIQDFAYVKLVFRWTSNLVNPSKLLKLLT